MIDYYDFGHIRVDGREYSDDVKIMDHHVMHWRYVERHTITAQDLIDLVEARPKIIVCGIGYNGLVRVADDAKKLAEKNGIKLIIQHSKEAVRTFNSLMQDNEKAFMIIHLTC